jgi:NFU1 iron-sulfur cluster scaffold homolog, mitochondrial
MTSKKKKTLHKRVAEIIENEVRPMLAVHGGDVALLGIKKGIVKLSLQGACKGCAMAQLTFRIGVENMLMEKFPDEIKGLEYD